MIREKCIFYLFLWQLPYKLAAKNNKYLLSHCSMGWESGHDSVGCLCLKVSHKSHVGQGCSLIWRLDWRKICFQAHRVVGSGPLLAAVELRTSVSYWPETTLNSLTHGLRNTNTYFFHARERKYSNKMDIIVLHNIITEVTSFHHLCHIYWLEARHRSYPHSREGVTQGVSSRKWASWGPP